MSRRPPHPFLALVLASIVATALVGCASVPRHPDEGEYDPIEPVNRGVFAVNRELDRFVIKPAAKAYRATLPEGLRERIRAFVDNAREPLVLVNNVLQGRGDAAATTTKRFIINTTFGVLGFWDRATEAGFAKQSGDFGETLYFWGVGEGPYLVLPLFGPSTLRDAVGLGVDLYTNPVAHIGSRGVRHDAGIATTSADGIDKRARNIESLDLIEESSLDFYSYLRSAALQRRRALLREAKGEPDGDELVDPGAAPGLPAGKS